MILITIDGTDTAGERVCGWRFQEVFSNSEDHWLEFLNRHLVQCQKYIWLKFQQLQRIVGMSWFSCSWEIRRLRANKDEDVQKDFSSTSVEANKVMLFDLRCLHKSCRCLICKWESCPPLCGCAHGSACCARQDCPGVILC